MNKMGETLLYPMYKGSEDFVSSLTIYMDSKNRRFKKIKNKVGFDKFLVYVYDPVFSVNEYFEGKDSLDYRLGLDKTLRPKDYAFLPLRIPGKTIGHIKINKSYLIQEVVIYDDSINEFTKDMNFEKFLGKEVVIMDFEEVAFIRMECSSPHFKSEITLLMDKYLKEEYPKDIFTEGYTYLDYVPFDTKDDTKTLVYALRTPGATRANLVVDSVTLKIKSIVYIDETFNEEYKEELKEKLNNYIDRKINIRNWRG